MVNVRVVQLHDAIGGGVTVMRIRCLVSDYLRPSLAAAPSQRSLLFFSSVSSYFMRLQILCTTPTIVPTLWLQLFSDNWDPLVSGSYFLFSFLLLSFFYTCHTEAFLRRPSPLCSPSPSRLIPSMKWIHIRARGQTLPSTSPKIRLELPLGFIHARP